MADAMIRQILDVSLSAIARIRRQFSIDGLSAALDEKPRPGRPIKFGGAQRAQVTALACTTPPEGSRQWSLRLIADRVVELEFVESISYTSVRNILQKNELSPHLNQEWCTGELNSRYVLFSVMMSVHVF